MGARPSHVNNDTHPLLHPDIFGLVLQQLTRIGAPETHAFASTFQRARRLSQRPSTQRMLWRVKHEHIASVHPYRMLYPNPTSLLRALHRDPHLIKPVEHTAAARNLNIPLQQTWEYAVAHVPFTVLSAPTCIDQLALWRIAVRKQPKMLVHAARVDTCRVAWEDLSYAAAAAYTPAYCGLFAFTRHSDTAYDGMVKCYVEHRRRKWWWLSFAIPTCLCLIYDREPRAVPHAAISIGFAYLLARAAARYFRGEIVPPPLLP
jgi:hypothetical protein